VNLAYNRLYGRALKHERIKQGAKDVRFQRQSILSTIRLNGEQCPLVFSGTLNKELFAEYIEQNLRFCLDEDDILILDNCSVHRSKLVVETLEKHGINYMFLPPYSPDFNPIELMWTKIKSVLKKLKARTHERLLGAINLAISEIKLEFIKNWFRHCGYKNNIC
jgi:transposase